MRKSFAAKGGGGSDAPGIMVVKVKFWWLPCYNGLCLPFEVAHILRVRELGNTEMHLVIVYFGLYILIALFRVCHYHHYIAAEG